MAIQAVLFDVIGTTVKETDPQMINHCFQQAFVDHHIEVDPRILSDNRGRDKKEVIQSIVESNSLPLTNVDSVYWSFKQLFIARINEFKANDGAEEMFSFLRQHHVMIGLGTGLPRDLFEKVLSHLGWNKIMFDYIGIGAELKGTRPDPAMIIDMMSKLNLSDSRRFLKVGDTRADIQEGRNAGTLTVAILSGTQDQAMLEKEKPDYLINHLLDLKKIF
ncbi:MAG: HAD family hydrolase [Bacteroidota bacterium]